jgi:putative DNA primase/helicase
MQRLIGYGATGSTREQVLVFGYGGGCNGKSTLFDAIAFPLGDYCGRAAPDLLMSADRSGHPAAVADLFGKRLMLCNEVREGRRFDGAMVKQLTGETQIKARHMYGDFFEFPATHKLVIFSNHKPIVTEADWGFWRRMLLIPFTETIAESEKDYALPEKLKAEADGILTWIVRGACQWYREGLGVPSEVSDATRQYRSEMDVIGTFITECCVDGDRLTAYATALYETYRQWADANGEYVASQKKFGSQLRDRGYRSDRCGKTGRMVWFGLAAKEPVGDSRPHGRIIFN